MNAIHKIVGVLLCSAVLSVGLSNVGRAEHLPGAGDTMKTDSLTDAQKYNFQSDDDKQQNVKTKKSQASGEKTVKGELFRVDDANYFVKAMDGSEIRLHTDKTTNMKGKIKKGDRIEATVNDQNHALSIQVIK